MSTAGGAARPGRPLPGGAQLQHARRENVAAQMIKSRTRSFSPAASDQVIQGYYQIQG
jgi:hypothetical protein